MDGKYVLGCTVFVDLLSPCAIHSKIMQHDDLDILAALTSVLKAVKEVDKLSSTPLDQWPTYAITVGKCLEEDGKHAYQCQELQF